jgi:carbonic anhydrase
MDVVDILTERNDRFARHEFAPGMPLLPKLRTLVLCCVDPRVDPAHILGVELGDAAVLRNLGGRVTPNVIAEITALRTLTENIIGPAAPTQNLIILGHTDCGILRLQDPPELLANFFQINAASLGDKHVADPRAAVDTDIGELHNSPQIAAAFQITGMVYNVDTGRVDMVGNAAPLSSS